jgi:hypothetical protein
MPDMQQLFLTADGIPDLSQQRAFGPCISGFT